MRFIAHKTNDGTVKGKIALYCHALGVTRQGFYWYLKHQDDPWKYAEIAEKMRGIVAEYECNDTYGRCRMYHALKLKFPDEKIPGERTVYRIMQETGRPTDRSVNRMGLQRQKEMPGNGRIC